jgi:hypothetical protein
VQLFSDTLTREWLEATAGLMGLQLHEFDELEPHKRGAQKGKRRFKFLLRPISGHPEGEKRRLVRESFYGRPRRVWAVSWQGHWDFMVACFRMDESAQIRTSLATYDGMHGFYQNAPATGDRNIGSMMMPLAYREATVDLLP